MIEIRAASPFATIQDAGRAGYRAQGVGPSGAMDVQALVTANLLVGNAVGAAGIETSVGPLRLRFGATTAFAVCGAETALHLDGTPLPTYWCAVAETGQELEVAPSSVGRWNYVALSGGIDVPLILGSRGADVKIGIGGLRAGEPLRAGDGLDLGPVESGGLAAVSRLGGFGVAPPDAPRDERGSRVVRVLPAREYDRFTPESREDFWTSDWLVGRESNRMGYRLSGPVLRTDEPLSLPSYGVMTGLVQAPPSGQPIVLLNEANTCGGYPKAGVVIGPDLPVLVQALPGQALRMRKVNLDQALAARAAAAVALERCRAAARMAREWA